MESYGRRTCGVLPSGQASTCRPTYGGVRSLDGARVPVVSDDRGFVQEVSVGWRPSPGGWFYSEENEAGVWVSAAES
jgi:hypothetical protein